MSDFCNNAPQEGNSGIFKNFLKYDDFGLDYAESLTEGDLRPYVIENYTAEAEEGE